MRKPSEKLFHLSVTLFAITLTLLSAATLLYQRDPDVIKSWLSPLHIVWFPMKKTDTAANVIATNSVHLIKGNGVSNDLATMPIFHAGANDSLVVVKPFGLDVTAAKVANVQQLLSRYQVVNQVSQTLRLNITQKITVLLVKTPDDYENALASLGISANDAKRYSADTGGFTEGSHVIIPLYQNIRNSDLINTLGHELTHAFINVNNLNIPSWLNEGIAVYDGMKMQGAEENAVTFAGDERRLAESVLSAAKQGHLIPLAKDETAVLQGGGTYDLELQDWLAVANLIHAHGTQIIQQLFYRIQRGETFATSFYRSFNETEPDYNNQLTATLQQSSQIHDAGMQLTLTLPSSFKGYVRVLPHSSQSWQGVRVTSAGPIFMSIHPDGLVSSSAQAVSSTQDSESPDGHTVYINFNPDIPFNYLGQSVQDCGFAIDYHDGLYGFVNGWITTVDGHSVYFRHPSMFGISLTVVTELSSTSPVLTWIFPT